MRAIDMRTCSLSRAASRAAGDDSEKVVSKMWSTRLPHSAALRPLSDTDCAAGATGRARAPPQPAAAAPAPTMTSIASRHFLMARS